MREHTTPPTSIAQQIQPITDITGQPIGAERVVPDRADQTPRETHELSR